MAVTITSSTYNGEFAGKYIAAALLSADTIEGGGITVKPNVKYKEVMKTLSTNALVKNADCDFADQSTVTLTERVLTPKELQVNLELCKKDFHSDWEAVQMGYSAFDTLPPSFSDFLIGHIASKVAQKTEETIWQGVGTGASAVAGEFDGLVTLLEADTDLPASQDLTGVVITASNVIAQLGRVVDAIPSAVYGKEDLYIYVSQNIARAYVRALGGFGADGLGANGVNNGGTTWYNGGDLAFDGVKLFVCSGMPDNHMVAAQKSNIFFGTGLLSDHNEVKLIDMADLDGSQNVRVIMRFTSGVQYGIVGDIVLYHD
jgi:hypothetical protein